MFNAPTIDRELQDLDHLSLRDMADFLDKQAEILRQKALADYKSGQEQTAGAIDFLLRSPRIVMRFLRQGCTLDESLKKTADITGAPLESIQRAWRRFLYDKSHYELRRRNRLILELAALGFTNADIGRKVNMHANSVSRIIGKARRAYHCRREKEQDVTALPFENTPLL